MKSFLVIGLGRFGTRLAEKLTELRHDVMVVDRDEKRVNLLADRIPNAQIADCTDPGVLASLEVASFDICFVTIGENFQSSLEITSQLKELGAKRVISKANRDIQAKFLLRNGADEVVYPERDMAEKLAIRCNADRIYDYIQLTPEYSIYELPIREEWAGRSIGGVDVRKKYRMNIVAVKKGEKEIIVPGADYEFASGDHVIVLATRDDVTKMQK